MKCPIILLAVLVTIPGVHGVSHAATLLVANNGVDSPTCGAKGDPCRSINQAIGNANDKDRIRVGPGTYTRAVEGNPGGCFCLVRVNKPVKIESVGGAGVTILDAQGLENNVVRIMVDGVQFGRRNRGFGLTGATDSGLRVLSQFSEDVRIEGNRAIGNGDHGFEVSGIGHVLGNNEARNNGIGFLLLGGTGITLKSNVASQNTTIGFEVESDEANVFQNVASANGTVGFAVGDQFGGDRALIRRNVSVGNVGAGIIVAADDVVVTQNSLFGNDAAGSNCGLENDSGSALSAEGNYWGASSGPGAEPADALCETNGVIQADPFATKEITVTPGAGR